MRRLPLGAAVLSLTAALVAPAHVSPASAAPATTSRVGEDRLIDHTAWDGGKELRSGTQSGTRVRKGALVMKAPTAKRAYAGTTYDVSRWESPWVTPGFGLTELVPSWEATTPKNSWIEVRVRGRAADGTTSSWDVMGRWAATDAFVRRSSVSGQNDDLAKVNVDTWQSASADGLISYQVRVSLMRKSGARSASPTVDAIGAMSSRLPSTATVATSEPGSARGMVLDVPRYSQMVHDGDYAQWGGGGEAWCSPTATSMVLGYYRSLPAASAYSWVQQRHVDPWVDYAARMTYDSTYDGTGNWPFNTAYAASLTGHAFVTRLRSLREAEQFIMAGIPVVASISFGSGGLSGAPISASNGHLLVIVGFTANGDVVVNDPASPDRKGVRRTYDRGQFENAWLPTSGGLSYVITDDAHPLPPGVQSNW